MALKEFLVLRCLAQRGLEGRMALIQPLGQLDYSLVSGRSCSPTWNLTQKACVA
jgi:hypothetical protein